MKDVKRFEILEHTADLKIRVWGKDLSELFKNAALGMYSAACGREFKIKKEKLKTKEIKIKGQSYESLLVNYLNELLYLSDVNNLAYLVEDLRFEKEIELKARLKSFPLSALEFEIKGATYHGLKIEKLDEGYQAEILFDI